ncbi:MAG: hypothetical protein SGJ18_08540 [Pseudomonadota bacterium]|nr:hypothetical protein [Pseudomonadota bacterium]
MKLIIALLILNTANSAPVDKNHLKQLDSLGSKVIAKDFRIVFSEKKNVKICGGEGDAYLGQVQVNKYSRGYDSKGTSNISDQWANVDKMYVLYKSKLSDPKAKLFDVDQCME